MYGRAILGALDFLCSLQVSRKAATESKAGEESLRRVNVRAVVCGHHLLKQSLCGLLPLRCTCGHLFAPKQLTMVRADVDPSDLTGFIGYCDDCVFEIIDKLTKK